MSARHIRVSRPWGFTYTRRKNFTLHKNDARPVAARGNPRTPSHSVFVHRCTPSHMDAIIRRSPLPWMRHSNHESGSRRRDSMAGKASYLGRCGSLHRVRWTSPWSCGTLRGPVATSHSTFAIQQVQTSCRAFLGGCAIECKGSFFWVRLFVARRQNSAAPPVDGQNGRDRVWNSFFSTRACTTSRSASTT